MEGGDEDLKGGEEGVECALHGRGDARRLVGRKRGNK